ncbi:MAG: PglZ domain-containing protein [Thermotogota bacterium]|nr:PglZ domain-containing protein [Thermotogota bacterium]
MAIVSIINDSFEIGRKEDALVVHGISDYVDTYLQIVDSIYNKVGLNVLVRDSTCFKWLSRLKDQYGANYIEILENSPREAIKHQWHLEHLPDDITDRAILEASLLDLRIAPKEGEKFENIILENFYSSLLTYPELPIGRLAELLEDLVTGRWKDHRKIPLIFRQYEKRLDGWREKRKKKEFEEVIEGLRNNPKLLQQQLMNYKVVKNYPSELGERILGEKYDVFRRLPLDLNDLKIERSSVEKAIYEIEIFLRNEVEVKTCEDLEILLTILSGELSIEFDIIRKAIYDLENEVTKDLIEKVKDKFSAISNQISTDIKELDLLIHPIKPSKPQDSWNAEEWLNWAINEYLPYQFWLEERNEYDKEIASFSERFADWFYKNFITLRTSFPRVLHNVVPHICHEIRASEGISVFVVIDNFNFKYMRNLESLLKQRGFFCKEPQGYFSMIPTETEVCKKCLLSGEPERNSIGNKSYKQIIEDDWYRFIGNKKFVYLSNLGALNKIKKAEHDVYFLNYCNIDELLHKDEDELGKPHREEVYHRIKTLVDLVISFARRLGIEHNLSIYICSDHGSTKIQAETTNYIDRKYYDAKSEDKHHRFVAVSERQMQNLPSHVENNCYVIRKKEYGLLENYLIAKGYGRFVKTTGKFYVHGGLSPEEVVVPFAVFNKIMAEPKQILVYLSQNTFRYSVKSTIKLNIGNTNEYEIVNIVIDIRNSNIECQSPKVMRVEPKGRVQVEIPARFKKSPNKKETNYLLMRIRYQFLGKDYIQDVEPAIVMKSMVQEKTELEELF